ncbi:helix-turn-helix transcriptional regulator [Solicola gregarius]|uniref:WYL domain-containing protein n=1 Tax=Solicola gregarius TaxID=2908642 RepID=A0AA46YKX3_9ACTN|nr:WYL domain-containing protein [Solicola gregarius]UYM05054.1 WYL domain-containing protein [Solicola gregarius]
MATTTRKSERLMNLVIALLVSRGFLPKDRIRDAVTGYHGQSAEAFDRMFERDKDELRDIGIEIEVGSNERLFEDEIGYRIRRDEFELPEITLEAHEAAVVGLAARVWQHARLATEASSAVVKLKAAGVPVDSDLLSLVEPQLAASEPAFEPLWDALLSRTPVEFTYGRIGQQSTWREVEPWGVVSWHGRWYLAGFDRGREGPRLFRLSRIIGDVAVAGAPGEYDVPDDADVRAMAGALFPAPADNVARVRAREGTALGMRRRALDTDVAADGWSLLTVPYASLNSLAEEVASYGPDVVAVEPAELVSLVVDRLRGVEKTHAGGAAR